MIQQHQTKTSNLVAQSPRPPGSPILDTQPSPKRCNGCDKIKPVSEFNRNQTYKDGLQSQCRACTAVYQQTHKIKRAKSRKEYHRTITGYLRECFDAIKQRCNNLKKPEYKYYGGRGIECRFTDSNDFIYYVMGVLGFNSTEKLAGLQIDRINNDGHYEMGNIRFVTRKVNCNNRRDNIKRDKI